MNPETNDTSFIAIFPAVENATGASGLYVLPRRNDLGKTEALTTINVAPAFGGDKMARIMLRPNREWIALDPASGALEPEEEEAIGVTLRTGSDEADWLFPLGVYRAEISVSSPNLSGILIPVTLTVTPLAAPVEVEAAPSETVLTTLYPQPFNSGLAIEYRLARRGEVSLKLFDLAGREAGVIEEGMREAGDHSVRFDAGELASGIYWIRLEAGGLMSVRKAALVR